MIKTPANTNHAPLRLMPGHAPRPAEANTDDDSRTAEDRPAQRKDRT